MLFVIHKSTLRKTISVVRDDRTKVTRGPTGPFLRLEAKDNQITIDGNFVSATIPATVYERGVLFLRATIFRRLLATIRNQKFLTIQVMAEGLLIENVTLSLESNDMLLYPIPDQAPRFHPSVKWLDPPFEPKLKSCQPLVPVNATKAPRPRQLKLDSEFRQLLLWDDTDVE